MGGCRHSSCLSNVVQCLEWETHMRSIMFHVVVLLVCTTIVRADTKQATDLIKVGDYAGAIAVLRGTNDPQSLQMLGNCYKATKEWYKAIDCFEKLVAAPPPNVSAKDINAWIMDCHLANNNPSGAYNLLDKLIKEYPDSAPQFHYILGRRYMWNHQYAEAVSELRQAIEMRKGDPNAWDAAKDYILCCLTAMDFDSALAFLPTLAKEYPDKIPDVVGSQLYRWKFKIPKALEILQGVIDETGGSTNNELKMGLADCYVAVQNCEKARSILQSMPESYQDSSARWHTSMGKSYWSEYKQDEAVKELKRAIEISNDNNLKRLLMDWYRGKGDWANMLTQTQVLLKDWPENTSEWLLNEGWAYLDLGEYDKAIPIFKGLITRYPDQRWVVRGAIVSLSECLYKSGKKEEALSTVSDYYKDKPALQSEFLLMYAQALFHGPKDYVQSESYLRKLMAQYVGDPMAYQGKQFLVKVLEVSGKYGEAADIRKGTASAMPVWSPWAKVDLLTRAASDYYEAGKYKEASEVYEELINMDKSVLSRNARAECMYQLAQCQLKRGLSRLAESYLGRIISDYPDTPTAETAKQLKQLMKTLIGGGERN